MTPRLTTTLFAAVDSDAAGQLPSYRFARLDGVDDPNRMLALVAVAGLAAVVYVAWHYRRETASISGGLAIFFTSLRLIAVAGLIVYFLQPQKRTDSEVAIDSRVAVLADVSQSMGVRDARTDESSKAERAEVVRETLLSTSMLARLRAEHDVSLRVFDEQVERVAEWKRVRPDGNNASAGAASDNNANADGGNAEQVLTESQAERLKPLGGETRLGDALAEVLADESKDKFKDTLAGIILFSDGRQNSGIDPLAIAELAAERQIPIYAIGVGSTSPRKNVRVQQVIAPSRAYPGDATPIRALISGEGLVGRSVEVQLSTRRLHGDAETAATVVATREAVFDSNADVQTVEFEIEPVEPGRLVVEVRLIPPTDDHHAGDDFRAVEVEVVEASSRVLLVASGATREYRFLRNQLRRDPRTTVDIWLQLAPPGISQDADAILDAFPQTKEELFQYDCIVAFDPDWTLLDAAQVELLAGWVADQAGGMIVAAGPIHTSGWVQSAEHAKLRALYPVDFQRRLALLDDGHYGSEVAWPIAFSRAGQEAPFLMLAKTPQESTVAWEEFPGVYGCYAVKGPKAGAQVYGRYSDPDAGISADRPVYMAEHFYGAGRVFYLGSGEMWRLRGIDTGLFEVFYAQLIRHVTQGRLLRGSSRGMLLLERDQYRVGDDVTVRAQLSTAAQEPYVAESISVRATGPDGKGRNVALGADSSRPGNFVGQLTVLQEGAYRLELPVPNALDEQLTRRFHVEIPDLEFQQTERDERLLAALASKTGGRYFESPEVAAAGSSQ
ncbi:VWA domain-containing protein, partial [Pirellulales bacterium]|nr:VWA domain-containing protein [Pirellulales bacterium]